MYIVYIYIYIYVRIHLYVVSAALCLRAAKILKESKQFPDAWLNTGDIYWSGLLHSAKAIKKFAGNAVVDTRSRCELDPFFCHPYVGRTASMLGPESGAIPFIGDDM